jgi:hypothetical protein
MSKFLKYSSANSGVDSKAKIDTSYTYGVLVLLLKERLKSKVAHYHFGLSDKETSGSVKNTQRCVLEK